MTSTYTLTLPTKTLEDADPKARVVLEKTKAAMGMIPNMYGNMANSSALLQTYAQGYSLFREDSGFTSVEQEVVFLTISRENECLYCMAAHSFVADKLSNVPTEVTDAIRNDELIVDNKLAALVEFTRVMFVSRGNPKVDDVNAFIQAGYTEPHSGHHSSSCRKNYQQLRKPCV
jgi:AhpD family alkylhydroperoxidase